MGYIFKEMYYNKRWLNHRKNLDSFPYATDIMSEIKEVLSNTYPRKHKEHTTILEMYAFIKRTSRELNKVIKGREFFDLCTADENK